MAKRIDKSKIVREEIEWADRKRTIFGWPLSFTRYQLTKTKLISKIGFFSTSTNEILLYRILDVELHKTLGQKIFRVGSLHLFSADPSSPNFTIKSIKSPDNVKNFLSSLIQQEREEKNVVGRELYGAADAGDVDGGDHGGHHH